mgnify:CR=1 FL=1
MSRKRVNNYNLKEDLMNIGIKTVVMITLAALLGWSASTMAKAAINPQEALYQTVQANTICATPDLPLNDAESTEKKTNGLTKVSRFKQITGVQNIEKLATALAANGNLTPDLIDEFVETWSIVEFYEAKTIGNPEDLMFAVLYDKDGCAKKKFQHQGGKHDVEAILKLAFGVDS